ncbi:MAG TPA: hypothetical protein VLQ93_19325, partial [Myxococcaceae bacterium]|nr:hypothetical protein [Myxococcaceae bacterium]
MERMAAFVETGPIRQKAEQVAEALSRPEAFVWLSGGQGAEREVLLDELWSRFPDKLAVVRMAPLSSPDAVAHARLQLSVLSREGTSALELLPGSTDEALASSLRRMGERERILVLRMHPSWEEG